MITMTTIMKLMENVIDDDNTDGHRKYDNDADHNDENNDDDGNNDDNNAATNAMGTCSIVIFEFCTMKPCNQSEFKFFKIDSVWKNSDSAPT